MSEVLKFNRCPFCPSTAVSKDKLLRHITIHHRDDKSKLVFSCFLCHAMFHSYDDLKAHRKEIHESSWKDIFDSEEEDEAKSFYEQLLLESSLQCSLEETIQLNAAGLLHKLYEYTTQTVIDSVIQGSKFCQLARNSSSNSLSLDQICKTLDGFRHSSLFEGLQNRKLYDKYLEKENWLVPPRQVVLSHKEVLRRNNTVEQVPVEFGNVVCFLPLLEKLLNLPEVLKKICSAVCARR